MARVVKRKVKVLEYELPLKVEVQDEGGFLATSDTLQGVLAEGATVAGSVANAIEVAANIIDIRGKEGLSVPLKLIKGKRSSKIFITKVSVQVAY